MKRLRITHLTEYRYSEPVTFGPHRALMRPREGHDVHIEGSLLDITPRANVRWFRDMYGNSIAVLEFLEPGATLRVFSELDVAHYDENPLDFIIDPEAVAYPFRYPMDEQPELIPYRLSAYPRDGTSLRDWLLQFYKPGQLIGTFDLLARLNAAIFEGFVYARREERGVQSPAHTLAFGAGSCRDFAALMMEAARQWGFAARFVSGYLQTPPGADQHGATHAWTEIYIPGAGWRGFDPTNNVLAGAQHVSVAVNRDPEKAAPVSGSWNGSRGAFVGMHVDVQVVLL
ncbi:MAG: transglutaminase family protein [Terrimicrobiaceae bacterium]|nr:transglutaminase family protein [Terrimicrobiaceae bacterium]